MRDGLAITHACDQRIEIEVIRAMLGAEAVERSIVVAIPPPRGAGAHRRSRAAPEGAR